MSNHSSTSFDSQAAIFDQRVGLPEKTCREIVQAILSLAQIQPNDLILEIGAGTGQIGQWLVQESVRYLGLDISEKMLDKFRERLTSKQDKWTLIQADGNKRWPIKDNTIRVIFSSRTLHLIDIKHIVSESFRVAHPQGAVLLIGSVQRQEESVKARMKNQMHYLLQQHGFQGRQKKQSHRELLELCCQRGAQEIKPLVVSRWWVSSSPQHSLDNWQQKESLAGINLPVDIQQKILKDLQSWAQITFNRLEQPLKFEEEYVLQGVYLTPTN